QKRGASCHFSPMRSRRSNHHVHSPVVQLAAQQCQQSIEHIFHTPPDSSHDRQGPRLTPSTQALPPSASSPSNHQLTPRMSQSGPLGTIQPTASRLLDDSLYIDELLATNCTRQARTNDRSTFTADDDHVGSSALAFYSEKSMSSLSERLGHDRVRQLLATIETSAGEAMNVLTDCDPSMISNQNLQRNLHSCKPFMVLFYAVISLGCMNQDGGSFKAGKGTASQLFSRAALCAMAVYSLTAEGYRHEGLFIREAGRAASAMSKRSFENPMDEHCRQGTFWVIYYIEKEYSFHTCMASVICDADISCPLPNPTPVILEGLDWVRTSASFSRLLWKAYVSLFSISATFRTKEEQFEKIAGVTTDIDNWLKTIPEKLCPNHGLPNLRFTQPGHAMIVLRLHFMYYGLIVSLARLKLHLSDAQSTRRSDATVSLLMAARAIVALVQFIPQEPSTPMICLIHMPMMAMFVLFDCVVHNPHHPETAKSLAFLDITAGYFSRLELVYASQGAPGTVHFGEFTAIAHEYVRRQQQNHSQIDPRGAAGRSIPANHDRPSPSSTTTAYGAMDGHLEPGQDRRPYHLDISQQNPAHGLGGDNASSF
ncbi:uncharacterized protein B0I36DRAFT_249683, partial [Microdochium trichocladiopsis]